MPFDGRGIPGIEDFRIEKLDQVISLLRTPEQWCQGRLHGSFQDYCIRGAMRIADPENTLCAPILQAIRQTASRRFARIESFNDHAHTTHGAVLKALQTARGNIIAGTAVNTMVELDLILPRPLWTRISEPNFNYVEYD